MNICRHIAAIAVVMMLFGIGCSRKDDRPVIETRGQVYVTGKKLEPDKLASVWLIKRFVDKDARFQFVDDARSLTNGIPFDVPEAEYRRSAIFSCFEIIANKHAIQVPGVRRLSGVIHDIEINYWAEKRFPETASLNQEIKAIIDRHPNDPETCVQESSIVFDKLLKELSQSSPPDPK